MKHKADDEIVEAVFKANLRAYEILHKYAMQTKNTTALDLLEAAQKEIITPLTNTTMTTHQPSKVLKDTNSQVSLHIEKYVNKISNEEIVEDFFPATSFDYDPFVGEALQERKKELLSILEAKDADREKAVEEIMQDLIVFRDDIPEAYGWGEEDKEADRGYQICSQVIKAELTKFINKRLTPPNN
jgi:hypothetical protein